MKKYKKSKFGPPERNRKGYYYICEKCKTEFYVMPSRVRVTEEKGIRIRFCSIGCYNRSKFGKGNPFHGRKHTESTRIKFRTNPNRRRFKADKDNPNIAKYGILPGRMSTSARWKRFIRTSSKPFKCERCGFSQVPEILILHHKDRNRRNNRRSNIELLCPNCHESDHFLNRDGRFKPRRKKRVDKN